MLNVEIAIDPFGDISSRRTLYRLEIVLERSNLIALVTEELYEAPLPTMVNMVAEPTKRLCFFDDYKRYANKLTPPENLKSPEMYTVS